MARHKVEISGVDTANIKVLSNEEQIILFKKMKEGDKKAKDKLVEGNLKLVLSILRCFVNRTDNMDDLFQIGCIGLIKAYNNYDSNMNVKFTTYAYPYILGEMRKLVREDKSMKISRDISKINLQIEKAYVLLTQKMGKEPTVSEIASFLEVPISLVVDALNSSKVSSLDDIIYDNLTVFDVISDTNTDMDTLIALKSSLDELTSEEKEIINLRYMNDLTQMEVSKLLGISQVQVSRKEQKVLVKMRDKIAC